MNGGHLADRGFIRLILFGLILLFMLVMTSAAAGPDQDVRVIPCFRDAPQFSKESYVSYVRHFQEECRRKCGGADAVLEPDGKAVCLSAYPSQQQQYPAHQIYYRSYCRGPTYLPWFGVSGPEGKWILDTFILAPPAIPESEFYSDKPLPRLTQVYDFCKIEVKISDRIAGMLSTAKADGLMCFRGSLYGLAEGKALAQRSPNEPYCVVRDGHGSGKTSFLTTRAAFQVDDRFPRHLLDFEVEAENLGFTFECRLNGRVSTEADLRAICGARDIDFKMVVTPKPSPAPPPPRVFTPPLPDTPPKPQPILTPPVAPSGQAPDHKLL